MRRSGAEPHTAADRRQLKAKRQRSVTHSAAAAERYSQRSHTNASNPPPVEGAGGGKKKQKVIF